MLRHCLEYLFFYQSITIICIFAQYFRKNTAKGDQISERSIHRTSAKTYPPIFNNENIEKFGDAVEKSTVKWSQKNFKKERPLHDTTSSHMSMKNISFDPHDQNKSKTKLDHCFCSSSSIFKTNIQTLICLHIFLFVALNHHITPCLAQMQQQEDDNQLFQDTRPDILYNIYKDTSTTSGIP